MNSFSVAQDSVSQRVDAFLAHQTKLSRAFVSKLFIKDKVLVNGRVVKTSYKLKLGDEVVLNFDIGLLKSIQKIDLPIVYENEQVIVINKPSGLLTHSKGDFNPEPTVASFISSRIKDMEGNRAGIVHRLDRGTSGVIICAKDYETMKWLQKQFSTRKVIKKYQAIVSGTPDIPQAVIDMPIGRNPKKPQTFRTDNNGRPAKTEYQVLKSNDKFSVVLLKPQTGRTHQLRVHMKQLGNPIIGDTLYAGIPAKRLYLHATSLELTLPNKERRIFEVPLPKEFTRKEL